MSAEEVGVEYVSYRANALFAESMLSFMNGAWWGAAWSCVTPFYPVGSLEYKREVATGIFRPAPPFHAMRGLPSNTLFFASIFATKSLCTRSVELIRRQEDYWNDIVGIGGMMAHIKLISSDRRLLYHNRAVGSVVALGLLYANLIA